MLLAAIDLAGIAVVERMPDLFGDEGHEGRKQAQRCFKN